jgi:hypothetical protein
MRLDSRRNRSNSPRLTLMLRSPIRTAGSSPRWISSYQRLRGIRNSSAASGTVSQALPGSSWALVSGVCVSM